MFIFSCVTLYLGTIPPPRYGHTVTRVGNKVFLFGGRDTYSTNTLNDFYYLDLGTRLISIVLLFIFYGNLISICRSYGVEPNSIRESRPSRPSL